MPTTFLHPNLHAFCRSLAAVAAALTLWTPVALAAQEPGSIAGRVVTADGAPVTDATVTLVATGARAAVDGDGRFAFATAPAGTQLLEVASKRHARGVDRVTVVPGAEATVEILLVSRVHSEQIVVTASPTGRGELDLASPVNIVDGQELSLRLQPSIGETLAQEPGISSTSFAPGASRPVIRGLGGDRIKMLENGIGTGDVSSTSPDHAVAADPLTVERIEVLRGPATLLYGGSAIGGVVNLLDRRIPDRRPVEPFSGTVDLRGGSVASERSAAVTLDGGGGPWAWHLDALDRETDDFEIPGHAELEGEEHEEEEEEHEEEIEGLLANSDLSATSGGFGVSRFFGDRGYLGVSVRGLDSQYGVPGGHHHEEEGEGHEEEEEEGEEHEEEALRIDMRQRRYDINAATEPFGAFQGVKVRFGVVDYEHDELEAPGVVGTTFFSDAWEGRVELIQKARGAHTGSFGVQVQNRELEAIGEEAFIPPAETDTLGVFTFQEVGKGAVRYQMGARYETQETTVRDADLPNRDFAGVSGSFGIVWRTSGSYSLGASVARSVKMPNSEELYSNGLHFATSSFELGDPTLVEESALGVDVALRKSEGRVTGSFSLFYNDFADFIFQRFTGDEVEELPVLQYSQADAEFRGAELEVSIALAQRAHSSWDLDLLGDLVRAELADGGNLPRIPPRRYGVGMHYRGDRLHVGAESRRVDGQDRVSDNETPTAGYTMVNASLGYRFFFADQILDLTLRGTNLTDEEARNHASFVKDTVPLPGRDISLIARFAW